MSLCVNDVPKCVVFPTPRVTQLLPSSGTCLAPTKQSSHTPRNVIRE